MKNKLKFIYIILVTLFIVACDEEDDDEPRIDDRVICTLEFRTYTVKVQNDTLDDYYTTRPSILDTILADGHVTFSDSTYIVLSDAYHSDLVEQIDTFYFHGIINDSIALKEKYVFKADQCHVIKLSGPEVVSL